MNSKGYETYLSVANTLDPNGVFFRQAAKDKGYVPAESIEAKLGAPLSRIFGRDRTPIIVTLDDSQYIASITNSLSVPSRGLLLNQQEHQQCLEKRGFEMMPADVYFAVIRSILEGTHGNSQKEAYRLLDKMREEARNFYVIFGSNAVYGCEKGEDALIHGVGRQFPRVINGLSLVGLDGRLTDMQDGEEIISAAFGIPSLVDAEQIIYDFCGKRIYLERINKTPNFPITCPLKLAVVNNRFELNLDETGESLGVARGVVLTPLGQ